jgi:hypothetical protein
LIATGIGDSRARWRFLAINSATASCHNLGVGDHETVDPLGMLGGKQLGHRAAVVMADRVAALHPERIEEADHGRDLRA